MKKVSAIILGCITSVTFADVYCPQQLICDSAVNPNSPCAIYPSYVRLTDPFVKVNTMGNLLTGIYYFLNAWAVNVPGKKYTACAYTTDGNSYSFTLESMVFLDADPSATLWKNPGHNDNYYCQSFGAPTDCPFLNQATAR